MSNYFVLMNTRDVSNTLASIVNADASELAAQRAALQWGTRLTFNEVDAFVFRLSLMTADPTACAMFHLLRRPTVAGSWRTVPEHSRPITFAQPVKFV